MKLLYVEASPRKALSASAEAAAGFIEALTADGMTWEVDKLDLWSARLPEFDGAAISAKYAKLAGLPLSEAQSEAWAIIAAMVERVEGADRILIATPMWNFGIPYKLKHWIDLITQPGLTFSFDPARGYTPLLASKPTYVILSSAGDYRSGPSFGRPDLATPYLQAALNFIGLKEIVFIPLAPTVGAADRIAAGRDAAHERLRGLAAELERSAG